MDSLFLFSLTLCLFLSVLDDEDTGGKAAVKVILLGVCMGLCGNVRANTFILAPFFPVFIFAVFSRRRCPGLKKTMALVLLYGVGLAAAVSPFVIRNYHVAGEIALTTSQTGRNLYYGNSLENEFPYYRPAAFASSVPGEQAVQFVIEAVSLCLIGGGTGILFGTGLAALVCSILKWKFLLSFGIVMAALGISTLIGMGFGIYPAYKASKLTPVEALRAEH